MNLCVHRQPCGAIRAPHQTTRRTFTCTVTSGFKARPLPGASARCAPEDVSPASADGQAFTRLVPALPQHDLEHSVERTKRLQTQQLSYIYDQTFLPPIVLSQSVPGDANFSFDYILGRVSSLAGIPPQHNLITNMAFTKPPKDKDAPFQDIKDYNHLFDTVPLFGLKLPAVAKTYNLDVCFAEQRVAGANPVVIQSLKPDDSLGRAEILKTLSPNAVPENFALDKELNAGNIYIADYSGLDPTYTAPAHVAGGTFLEGKGKSLPKPLAFFWWSDAQNQLIPLAIEFKVDGSEAGASSRVYTPFNNINDWRFAKLCVQIADANHHELSTHLCRTHLVMEPIAIGTARQLDVSHPLGILLRVHMRFHIANDALAKPTFFAPKNGTLENLMAGSYPEIKGMLAEIYAQWDLTTAALPVDLAARGVADPKKLKHYPFRDHGMLLWDATKSFIDAYVRQFYATEQDVKDDTELQAWARELASEAGGKVKGMPERVGGIDELVGILTTIVFTCGPLHSAVNYAQKQYEEFTPNMPFSAYGDVMRLVQQQTPVTEAQLLAMLPPYQKAFDQLNTLEVLTSYRFDKFGYWDKSLADLYEGATFEDIFKGDQLSGVRKAMAEFQRRLGDIGVLIKKSNSAGGENEAFPYEQLLPDNVLNSVSI